MLYNSNVIQVQSKFKIFKYFFIIELTHPLRVCPSTALEHGDTL